jgi:anti-sigma factor RsiW
MYCLNRLSGEDKLVFEDHFITCPKCTEEVEKAQKFIEAAKAAARRLKKDKPKD